MITAGTAYAEGGFDSYMSGVLTGFSSRQWYDGNQDNVSTNITLRGCTHNWHPDAPKTVELALIRDGFFSDTEVGRRTFSCAVSDQEFWGDQPAGTYWFRVTKIAGLESGPRLSVSSLSVRY